MKKIISISLFADELMKRIETAKDIECCREEIRNLALIAKNRIGDEKIEVNWKDN